MRLLYVVPNRRWDIPLLTDQVLHGLLSVLKEEELIVFPYQGKYDVENDEKGSSRISKVIDYNYPFGRKLTAEIYNEEAGLRSEEDELAAKLGRRMMEKFPGVVKEIVQEEKLAADSEV